MLATDTFVRLCRARDLLREVADRPLTLEDIARDAAMSHFHFIRQFTALFGITPHQYRIQQGSITPGTGWRSAMNQLPTFAWISAGQAWAASARSSRSVPA